MTMKRSPRKDMSGKDRTNSSGGPLSQPLLHRQPVHLPCPSTAILPGVLRINDLFDTKSVRCLQRATEPIILSLQLIIPRLLSTKFSPGGGLLRSRHPEAKTPAALTAR
jgi:hypothetical protein